MQGWKSYKAADMEALPEREIFSPSRKKMDYMRKPMLYWEIGVQEYWIVDPIKEIIIVYALGHKT